MRTILCFICMIGLCLGGARADDAAPVVVVFPPENPLDCAAAAASPGNVGALAWNGVGNVRCQTVVKASANGRVGIGTGTPRASLDVVRGSVRLDGFDERIGILTYGMFPAGGSTADLNYDGGTDAEFFFAHTGVVDGATYFTWQGGEPVPRHLLTLRNSGEIGIGTPTPRGTLDITNATRDATLCLNGSCVSTIVGGHEIVTARVKNAPGIDHAVACPAGKKVLSGACLIPAGTGGGPYFLQNTSIEQGGTRFQCLYNNRDGNQPPIMIQTQVVCATTP